MANCMKFIDLGDGVTIICDLRFGHDGACRSTRPQIGERCLHVRDASPRSCIRAINHAGPHKFGDERAAP